MKYIKTFIGLTVAAMIILGCAFVAVWTMENYTLIGIGIFIGFMLLWATMEYHEIH